MLNCCGGIVVNELHTDVSTVYIDNSEHRVIYRCCQYTEFIGHTVRILEDSMLYHKVWYPCCDVEYLRPHILSTEPDTFGQCVLCGFQRESAASIGDSEEQEDS